MRSRLLSAVTVIIVVLFAVSAAPAEEGIRWYAGIGAGISNDGIFSETDTGIKLFGGIELNQYFGMEAAFVDLGEFAFGFREQDGVAIEAVGSLPLGEKFKLFAKTGMFAWDVERSGMETDHGINGIFGVGGQWAFVKHWELRIEYERFNGISGGDIALVSIGVLYRS